MCLGQIPCIGCILTWHPSIGLAESTLLRFSIQWLLLTKTSFEHIWTTIQINRPAIQVLQSEALTALLMKLESIYFEEDQACRDCELNGGYQTEPFPLGHATLWLSGYVRFISEFSFLKAESQIVWRCLEARSQGPFGVFVRVCSIHKSVRSTSWAIAANAS